MATEANETTPRTGPPAAVGARANGAIYPVNTPGTDDWHCTQHQAYHPNGNRCLLEPASLKDPPPAASVRWEQDNDHPGFAPPANDSAAETTRPPRSPAAGAKSNTLTATQLVRLAEAQRYLERTIDMIPKGTTLRWDGRLWVYVPDAGTNEIAYQQGWQAGYAEGYDRCGKDLAATEAFADAPPGGYCRVQAISEYLLPHCQCVGVCQRGLPGFAQPAMVDGSRP